MGELDVEGGRLPRHQRQLVPVVIGLAGVQSGVAAVGDRGRGGVAVVGLEGVGGAGLRRAADDHVVEVAGEAAGVRVEHHFDEVDAIAGDGVRDRLVVGRRLTAVEIIAARVDEEEVDVALGVGEGEVDPEGVAVAGGDGVPVRVGGAGAEGGVALVQHRRRGAEGVVGLEGVDRAGGGRCRDRDLEVVDAAGAAGIGPRGDLELVIARGGDRVEQLFAVAPDGLRAGHQRVGAVVQEEVHVQLRAVERGGDVDDVGVGQAGQLVPVLIVAVA